MAKIVSRASLIWGWFAALAVGLGLGVAAGASLSTTALFFVVGLTPIVIVMLLAGGAPAPAVAEILYATEARGSR